MAEFWNQQVEPLRAFRWFMPIGTGGSGQNQIETWAIKTVKKPSFTISETQHQYVAHTFYYPGRITWNPIDVTFVDPVITKTSTNLFRMLLNAGYEAPVANDVALKSFSKKTFGDTIGDVVIHQIDTDGQTIPNTSWELKNPFITSADFGQLDYSSEELVVNSVTFRYDYAVIEGVNASS